MECVEQWGKLSLQSSPGHLDTVNLGLGSALVRLWPSLWTYLESPVNHVVDDRSQSPLWQQRSILISQEIDISLRPISVSILIPCEIIVPIFFFYKSPSSPILLVEMHHLQLRYTEIINLGS